MPRVTSDEDGKTLACPGCDRGGCVYEREADNTHAGDPDDPFICEKCSETFDEPVEREVKPGGGRKGSKSMLEQRLEGIA